MIERAVWETLEREFQAIDVRERPKVTALIPAIVQAFDRAPAARATRVEYYCRICGLYDRRYALLLWHVEDRHRDCNLSAPVIGTIGRVCADTGVDRAAARLWLRELVTSRSSERVIPGSLVGTIWS